MQIKTHRFRLSVCAALLLTIAVCARVATRPALLTAAEAQTVRVPAPEEVLGFRPGDDRKLASWAKVVEYFQKLAAASDRVKSPRGTTWEV